MTQVSSSPFEGLGLSNMLTDHCGGAELQMEEYVRCAERLMSDGRRNVLDWGYGFGHLAQQLHARGMAVSLYDYEPTVGPPRTVTLNQYPHLRATVSSDEVSLPFADGHFDAVVSMGTLEHVQHPLPGRELISSAGFAIISGQYMNMLPLISASRLVPRRYLPAASALNRGLSSLPGLNVIATNVEIVAVRTDA